MGGFSGLSQIFAVFLLAMLVGCSQKTSDIPPNQNKDTAVSNVANAPLHDEESVQEDKNSPTASAQYILETFSQYCDAPKLHLHTTYKNLLRDGWRRLPPNETDAQMKGILPHDRVGFVSPDADMPVIILSAQGEITAQNYRLRDGGLKSVSSPIEPAIDIPDILGVGTPKHIGGKNCRVIARTNDIDGLMAGISIMSVFGEPISRCNNRIWKDTDPHTGADLQRYVWCHDDRGSNLNVWHETSGSKHAKLVNISLGAVVYAEDESESYRFPGR